MQAEDANSVSTNPARPIFHLLYRPSHYDILYKDTAPSMLLQQAMNETTQNPNIQVNRATSFSQQHTVQSTSMNVNLTGLLSVPGFQCAPPSHHGFQPQFQSLIEQPHAHSLISASISPVLPCASLTAISSNTNLSLSVNFAPQQAAMLASPTMSTAQSSYPPRCAPTTHLASPYSTFTSISPVLVLAAF